MTTDPVHPEFWAHPAVILVPTDLTDIDRLMPFAIQQAKETGARLILLHVLTTTAVLPTDVPGMPYYDTAEVLEFADKTLLPWCEQAREQGVSCEALVREGNAAQQIAAAARQFQADRILLGTRSRSKLSKLLVGSVADQVLRSANIPVMTVGPEAHLPVDRGEELAILHATTLRETSRASAALACKIASDKKAKLYLLHVLPPQELAPKKSEVPDRADAAAIDEMRVLALRVMAHEIAASHSHAVEPLVVHGNPSIEILASAEQVHASLIVLTATHRSGLENLTRDRTVCRVLAHAHCPVLTLREEAAEAAEHDLLSDTDEELQQQRHMQ